MDHSAQHWRALLSAPASDGRLVLTVAAPLGAGLTVDTRATAAVSTSGRTAAAVTHSRHAGAAESPRSGAGVAGGDDQAGAGADVDGESAPMTSRDVSGLAVPWHVPVHRFGVEVVFTPETLRIPDPIDAVKLLVQHDDERPIGSAVSAVSDPDGLRPTFTLPLAVDRVAEAMTELDEHLREGLSVGVEVDAETIDAILDRLWMGAEDDAEPIPLAGVLREVSLVTVPQFLAARVEAEAVPLFTFESRETMPPTTRAASTLAPNDSGALQTSTPVAHPTNHDGQAAAFTLEELAAQLAPLLGSVSAAPHPLARFGSLDAFLAAAHDSGTRGEDGARVALALADQITTNNPGVLPPTWLADVVGIIDRGRPAITAFGGAMGAGDSGMSIDWPYYDGDPSTLVGEQAAEKTEVTTGRVDIKAASAGLRTYAGASDISYQLLKRSSPSYRELYARILAIAFAIRTDTVFCADLVAAASAGVMWDGTTLASLNAALFEASGIVDDALGAPASIVLAAPDVFALVGNLEGLVPPAYGTQNVGGTAQASTLAVNVSGLIVQKDRNLAAGSLIVSGDGAAKWREDGPYPIEAEDVAVLGRDVGIWGMGVTTVTVPAAVLSVGVTAPPPLADDQGRGRRSAKSE